MPTESTVTAVTSPTLMASMLVAAAVLSWPSPTPADRVPELRPPGSAVSGGTRGTNSAEPGADGTGRRGLPGWAWFALVPAALWAGPAVALALVMVVRTALSMIRQTRRRADLEAGTGSAARAADVLAADLRAGATPVSALEAAADEAGEPLAEALAAAASRARLGGSVADSLDRAVDDGPAMTELRRLAGAWRVAEMHGLRLADVIDHGRGDIAARRAHRSRTSAALAGPRMTMLILMSLPLFGVAMGQALGANPVGFLIGGGLGGVVLVVGVGLTCAGALWGTRILASAEGTR
ncbi:type II secretion system F family protein [uncultured Corynebacterium sp.]|uniref:type II secretion system F family protein n=1 Tax=uncultured Corynebacterium sp. TaxID=159447 RepID=UPI0025D16133|nr:type II secretion system F family protein [uncultured Corynebacterium sp.]